MLSARRALLLATTALVPLGLAPAYANPVGATIAGGSAQVSGEGTANLTVNQATDKAIINWHSFDIGNGETTQFVQPSTDSVTLNRVTGGLGSSDIDGTLKANGKVFLINPDGILFGANSVVDVGGLVATTNDIKNDDFMAGRYVFGQPGKADASVVNAGTITAATGGFAALVAPGVRNSGTVTARLGKVGLAASNGFTLDFYGDQLLTLNVDDEIAGTVRDVQTGQTLDALVKNEGALKADGGVVQLTAAAARQVVDSVINTTGIIEANAVGLKNGKIVLSAATADSKPAGTPTQKVKVSGKLSAAGKNPGETGGKIQVTGEDIALSGATIDASGPAGGGTVLVGGDVGGGNPSSSVSSIEKAQLEGSAVPNANNVSVDPNSTIDVSATDNGDGGKAIVWADFDTDFAGTIYARGGDRGGDGGYVETSGRTLDVGGATVDTSALNGLVGTWLLDPYDLTIDFLNAVAIDASLAFSNVTVQTTATGYSGLGSASPGNGDINVNSNIYWLGGNTLTLSAFRNINVEPNVTLSNFGAGNLVLVADNTKRGSGVVDFVQDFSSASGYTEPTTGFSDADFSHSTGSVSIYYNPGSTISVRTNDSVPNQLKLHTPKVETAAYMTGTYDPWLYAGLSTSPGSPDSSMNEAFGAGQWDKFYGFNPAVLSGLYKFFYLDGGGITSAQFNRFIGQDRSALENYVSAGGTLFVNAARWTNGTDPNDSVSGTLNLGFGAELQFAYDYSLASYTGTAVDLGNPIFTGPIGTAGNAWLGDYFSHDIVSGAGLHPLIVGTEGTVLASERYGLGFVMVGAITSPFTAFQLPQPQAANLRANILAYTAAQYRPSTSRLSDLFANGQTVGFAPPPPQPPSVISSALEPFVQKWEAQKDVQIPPSNDAGHSGGHDAGDYAVEFNYSRLGGVTTAQENVLKQIMLFTEEFESYRDDFYVPGGNSGVTIGHGIDFGALDLPKSTYSALVADVSLPSGSHSLDWWANTLSSLGGKTGNEAIALMNELNGETTAGERESIFKAVEPVIFTDRLTAIAKIWNSTVPTGGIGFYDLPAAEQTILFDLTFNHGTAWAQQYAALVADLHEENWTAAIAYLQAHQVGSTSGRNDAYISLLKALPEPTA